MKKGVIAVISIFIIIAVASFASANLFDDIKKLITGKASSGSQNVSVQVLAVNSPVVEFVQNINGGADVPPLEAGIRTVVFEVHISDADGAVNINDPTVAPKFTRGVTTRTGSCSAQPDINSLTANYSCSVGMWYYDETGIWNVNVSAKDMESNYAENTSESFNYGLLKAFAVPLSPSVLNWPTLSPGAINQQSNNDPTVVNNTGNYAGNISLQGRDLVGESTPSENISINNFRVAGNSGAECSGTVLGPGDGAIADTGITANSGPEPSVANIYYCISTVPIVSSQNYSTSTRGPAFSWTVSY